MLAQAGFHFALPAALVVQGFALRDEGDADIPFAMRLFGTTRADELALVDWSEDQKSVFVAQQFNAQRHHYKTLMNCQFQIIEHHGAPVGRLYLEPRQTQIAIVDIALMPDACGKGTGSVILKALIAAAAQTGRGVGIFVEKNNPARHLYDRLGFTLMRELDVYLEMEVAFAPDT